MKAKNCLSLIETAYDLDGDDALWVAKVLNSVAAVFDRGWFPSVVTYRYDPISIHIDEVVAKGPRFIEQAQRNIVALPNDVIDLLFRSGNLIGTASELVFDRCPERQSLFRRFTRGNIGDSLGIVAHSGTDRGIGITQGLPLRSRATAMERKRWAMLASHLGSGLRLRTVAKDLTLESYPVEAIFDGGGHLHHAREGAAPFSARHALRNRVRLVDTLRSSKGHTDPDRSMSAWSALIDGRWSLVDYFDTDQKRFVVAIKNDPQFPDPRGLTPRERQVAQFVGLGQSGKQISYTLGITAAAVSNCTASAQAKLGLRSRAELASFFSPAGLRAKLAEVSVRGEQLLVGSFPLINPITTSKLTDAEMSIVALLLSGCTNAEIARRRNASVNTVANQIHSVYKKLEVTSRGALAAQLHSMR